MPVHKVYTIKNGETKVGYQWGSHGRVYYGAGAKDKAEAQARAAYASGYRGSKNGKGRK